MAVISIYAGKSHYIKLVYKDGGGNIIDITGGTARLVVRKSVYSAILIDEAATVVGASGEMTFLVDPADTTSLLTSECDLVCVCGVELILASGKKVPFLEGSDFIIKQSVVR